MTLYYEDKSIISNAVDESLEKSRKEQEEKELRKIHESIMSVLEHSGEQPYEDAFTRETGLKKHTDSVEIHFKVKDRGSDSQASVPFIYSTTIDPYKGLGREKVIAPIYETFCSLSGESFSGLDNAVDKASFLTDSLVSLTLKLKDFQSLKEGQRLNYTLRHFTDEILDSKELKAILEAALVLHTTLERKSAVEKLSRESNKDLLSVALSRFNLEVKEIGYERRIASVGVFTNERVNGYNCSALCLTFPGFGFVNILKVGNRSYSAKFFLLREDPKTGKPLPYEESFYSTGWPIYAEVLNWFIDRYKEEESLKNFKAHSDYRKTMDKLLYNSEKFLNEKELLAKNPVVEATPEGEAETPQEPSEETSQVKEFFTKQ